ncbi:MAG: pyruvate kinase [Bacillota bacterium]
MRKTKIVCTLGPATDDEEILRQVIDSGLDVARFNFSHGNHEEQKMRIDMVKKISKEIGKPIGLMLDTKGPEVRTGDLKEGKVQLEKGEETIITTEEIEGDADRFSVQYKNLPNDLEVGSQILIDDGLIELVVKEIEGSEIKCEIQNGGELGSRKGVNLPGVKVQLPPLTEKDVSDIKFGLKQDIHFIAASFTRKASDIIEIRKLLEAENSEDVKIIPKIENQEAVDNIDEIIDVSDGLMVARGDLGVEIAAEKIPVIQKNLIKKCNENAKPVITATQMLDSMIRNPRPTRAEASDVANAIFDGTDATMLSGETAAGEYPVESVQMMAKIAEQAELSLEAKHNSNSPDQKPDTVTGAISLASCEAAEDLGAEAIITATGSGLTARMVSRYRPMTRIVAVTPDERVQHFLTLSWGVYPLLVPQSNNTDDMIDNAVSKALDHGLVKNGDLVTITAGAPVGIPGTTNLIKVDVVGKPVIEGQGVGKTTVTGIIKMVKTAEEANEKIEEGDILVTSMTDKNFIPAMEKAKAVITSEGGLTSHPAIVGLNLGMPVVVNAGDIFELLTEGETVTVDGVRGLVYRGKAHIK